MLGRKKYSEMNVEDLTMSNVKVKDGTQISELSKQLLYLEEEWKNKYRQY
jgi:hypothetical protein